MKMYRKVEMQFYTLLASAPDGGESLGQSNDEISENGATIISPIHLYLYIFEEELNKMMLVWHYVSYYNNSCKESYESCV
jgi:hypothetical protein